MQRPYTKGTTMVEDYPDNSKEKPIFANERKLQKQDVDLFPALNDGRMMAMGSVRQQTPTRLGTQISIFNPVSFEEAIEIVECLRSRAATTISLENMKKVDANRLVDFVAGASAALDGDFHKLSEQVYVFCPSNIRITAPIKETPAMSDTFAGTPVPSESVDLGLGALDFLYPTKGNQGIDVSNRWPSS